MFLGRAGTVKVTTLRSSIVATRASRVVARSHGADARLLVWRQHLAIRVEARPLAWARGATVSWSVPAGDAESGTDGRFVGEQ